MATVLALPWGKLQQEQAEHSAAPQERRLFAQDAAAGLVIHLHFPEAGARLVACPSVLLLQWPVRATL